MKMVSVCSVSDFQNGKFKAARGVKDFAQPADHGNPAPSVLQVLWEPRGTGGPRDLGYSEYLLRENPWLQLQGSNRSVFDASIVRENCFKQAEASAVHERYDFS